MREFPIALTLIVVVASVVGFTAPVVADDKWPDTCRDSPVIEPGRFTGTLTPDDMDVFRINVTDGDFISMRINWSGDGTITEFFQPDGANIGIEENDEVNFDGYGNIDIRDENSDQQTQFRFFGEEDGIICLPLQANDRVTDWGMSFSTGDVSPPQLDTGNNGSVVINVTVAPGNESQQFVDGGYAVVDVSGENVDYQSFSVHHGEGIYPVSEDGRVAVPLAETGRQEVVFQYGNVTETAVINVTDSS